MARFVDTVVEVVAVVVVDCVVARVEDGEASAAAVVVGGDEVDVDGAVVDVEVDAGVSSGRSATTGR